MHAGSLRPNFAGQIISAKYHINKRENGSEIMPVVFWVFAMVPVVVLWRGKNVFDEPEIDAGV